MATSRLMVRLRTLPVATYSAPATYSATNVLPLTSDMDEVHKRILELKWQRGFTNMAQAFSLADAMLLSGRKEAQGATMVLNDGKPSFRFQTIQNARELKEDAKANYAAIADALPKEADADTKDIEAKLTQ